jgi:hypothetical protein
MVVQTEAAFENGGFRLLDPMSLPDRHHVLLTVDEMPSEPADRHRYEEQARLRQHEREFAGHMGGASGKRTR